VFKSINYGEDFTIVEDVLQTGKEPGLMDCEFFNIMLRGFQYTNDCYLTYLIEKTIDEEYVFGQVSGVFPDVYRGGLPGEVYVSSWFPDKTYKVSFSADTGHTFRHVYIFEEPYNEISRPFFISDREPGVFYIIRRYRVEDSNPYGWHSKICIDYYRDYGETFVDTYCHNLHKNYGKSCEPINDLASEKLENNTIYLSWTEPESSLPVGEYRIYRNDEFLLATTNTTFLDENLPVGEYDYYVVALYEMGCVADSSNHVKIEIKVGISEMDKFDAIKLFPNPTTGELRMENGKLKIENVEILDVYGRKVGGKFPSNTLEGWQPQDDGVVIDLTVLQPGIYFVKITTEKGTIIQKIIKY